MLSELYLDNNNLTGILNISALAESAISRSLKVLSLKENLINNVLTSDKQASGQGLGRGYGIGGIAEVIQTTTGVGAAGTVVDSNEASWWAAMESWKTDVDVALSQLCTASNTQAMALEDLKNMFQSFLTTSKARDDCSPSITKSALENEGQVRHEENKAVGTGMGPNKKVLLPLPAVGGGGTAPRRSKRATSVARRATKGGKTTNTASVELSSFESEPIVRETEEPIVKAKVDAHDTGASFGNVKSRDTKKHDPVTRRNPCFR